MPPLMLTPAELEAIVLGAQWVAGRDDPLLSPAARDVLAKIITAIPAHLRPFVVEPSTGVAPRLVTAEEVVDIGTLRDAIRKRVKLRLLYRAENGEETERTVRPVVLGYSDTHRVLIAWCELRQGFRHFRTYGCSLPSFWINRSANTQLLLRRWEAWRVGELTESK